MYYHYNIYYIIYIFSLKYQKLSLYYWKTIYALKNFKKVYIILYITFQYFIIYIFFLKYQKLSSYYWKKFVYLKKLLKSIHYIVLYYILHFNIILYIFVYIIYCIYIYCIFFYKNTKMSSYYWITVCAKYSSIIAKKH